jgi:nitronate monooxygenase
MIVMFDLSTLAEPIVQAPMGGGPSTPELAIAVCRSGGLGFLAAGYKHPDTVRGEIEAVRSASGAPFGVNLFVPCVQPADPEHLRAGHLRDYTRELMPDAQRHGVELGEPRHDDDEWRAKLELLAGERVAVVSFTFGCPPPGAVERMHHAGSAVWVTVTSLEEARRAQLAGADALVVQGTEAGGHRGGFVDDEHAGGSGLLALLRVIASAVSLPLIATGGIADGAAVAAVLCAGASAAQVGTALMLAPEAGTAPAQRELLGEPSRPTMLTRAFSGRLARGIVNRFMEEHTATAPVAYPEIHHLTSPLRAKAREQGDADAFNLWAGQAHELAEERPAGEIVRDMGAGARRVLHETSQRLGQRRTGNGSRCERGGASAITRSPPASRPRSRWR